MTKEVYAKFRLSVDNGFRNEFAYVSYQKWGVMELWEGGRYTNAPPSRLHSKTCIEVWFNWELVGLYKSYDEARALIARLLKTAPVPLNDLIHYVELR